MRRHVKHFVRTELFPDGSLPRDTDRRFYPTAADYRNYIYRARTSKIHSKLDQVNLQLSIDTWRKQFPNDNCFFRQYTEIYEDQVVNSNTKQVPPVDFNADDEDDVLICNEDDHRGLLFVHQTEWQKRLLIRYGQEYAFLMPRIKRHVMHFLCFSYASEPTSTTLWLLLLSHRTRPQLPLQRRWKFCSNGIQTGIHVTGWWIFLKSKLMHWRVYLQVKKLICLVRSTGWVKK